MAISRVDPDDEGRKFILNVGIYQSTWRHIQDYKRTTQFFKSLMLSFLRKVRNAYKILVGKS